VLCLPRCERCVRRALQATLDGPKEVARLIKSGEVAGHAGGGSSALSTQCESCNDRKMAAKKAQEDFDDVYLCVFLRNAKAPYDTWATVERVGENAIHVCVDGLGATYQVYLDRNGADGEVVGEGPEQELVARPVEARSSELARAAVDSLTSVERRWSGKALHKIPFSVGESVRRLAVDLSVTVPPPDEESSGVGDAAIALASAAAAGDVSGLSDEDPVLAGAEAASSGMHVPYPDELRIKVLDRVRVRLVARDDVIPSGKSRRAVVRRSASPRCVFRRARGDNSEHGSLAQGGAARCPCAAQNRSQEGKGWLRFRWEALGTRRTPQGRSRRSSPRRR
jgi:hypothetical protein